MPPERFPPDDPREWLSRVRSSLLIAREGSRVEGVYLEDLCFEAQQAAEKALKALLLHRGIRFPHVHDLARLVSLLEQHGETVPESVREAEELTKYAVAARYPGLTEPASRAEYETAVRAAETVVEWVGANLRERDS